ncbi:actin cytoskeleton-regulatory complex protein PAN1-like [Humulus lupulus]|uniref:actin cytoskeleton-regulatory complex protein PAN1-like n=1 Tax=Humulus lupulus TaxID=3486 RepID=UPI002B4125B2|nr:actin cytoskeleton-regulatory complex protein PAN1-like [Humulus lupulus]
MPSKDMFDLYSVPDAPASKKKASRQHREECSEEPPAKKSCTEDPPAKKSCTEDPSKNTIPPPSPLEQQTPPTPVESTLSPPASVDQTQPAAPVQTGDDISSRVLRSVKERMTRILRTESKDAMLTVTASRLRSGVITDKSKSSDQRHAEELKAVEAKYAEQLEVAQKLEADLIESRQEADKLEARIKDLEKANANNLERYKGATSKCFYDFWKHNQGANFSYLPERMRQTEIAQCVARLAEEEKVKIPASPEISLATGIEGVDNEAEAAVDQENPQDPLAS